MKIHYSSTVLLPVSLLLFVGECTDCAFPLGIFPLLSSGWYYKPSPAESVILGLIVVKVLALRLASIIGLLPIPYHLNDLFLRSLGKRSISARNLTLPHLYAFHNNDESYEVNFNVSLSRTSDIKNRPTISQTELRTISRVLLGLRRIDVRSCFLKSLCSISHRVHHGVSFSSEDSHIITTLRYLVEMEKKYSKTLKSKVMDLYEKAISAGQDEMEDVCRATYFICPLSDSELEFESMLTESI